MAVLKATPSGYFLWDYVPSRPAAICFAALFFAGTVAVSWQSLRTRTKFAIPFIIGGMCKSQSFPLPLLCSPRSIVCVFFFFSNID